MKSHRCFILVSRLGLAALLPVLSRAAAPPGVVAHFPIGGDTSGYDYLKVDPEGRRLYVSHGTRVEVLDVDSGRRVGEVGPLTRAHGIAVAPAAGRGFATSGVDDLITVFDLKTLATVQQVKSTGSNPDAIEFDPETGKIFVANHGSGDLTVIDPATGGVVATIKFGDAKLEALCFDGRGQGFVNAEDKSAILVFDTHTLQAKATWPVAPGEGGTGLAIDAAHHRLFSACANSRVVVLDSDTGKVVATPAAGEDPDGLVFDVKTSRIYSSNPDGTLSVIQQNSADSYSPQPAVATTTGARTVTSDDRTGRVFVSAPKFGPKPAQVKGGPKPRAPILAGTFEVLVIGPK